MTDLIAELDTLYERAQPRSIRGLDATHATAVINEDNDNAKEFRFRLHQAYPQLREMARDAERYRWLRERGHYDAALPMNFHCNFPATCFRYDTLGAAIDAAMQGGDK